MIEQQEGTLGLVRDCIPHPEEIEKVRAGNDSQCNIGFHWRDEFFRVSHALIVESAYCGRWVTSNQSAFLQQLLHTHRDLEAEREKNIEHNTRLWYIYGALKSNPKHFKLAEAIDERIDRTGKAIDDILLEWIAGIVKDRENLQAQVSAHEEDCAILPENFSVTETVTALRKENGEVIDSLIKTHASLRDAPHNHVFGECNFCTMMDELEEQFPKLKEG